MFPGQWFSNVVLPSNQNLSFHSRLESDAEGEEPDNLCFNKPSGSHWQINDMIWVWDVL